MVRQTGALPGIRPGHARDDVVVHCPKGTYWSGPKGTPVEAFLRAAIPDQNEDPVMAALVNGRLCELNYPIKQDTEVQPVRMSSSDGRRVYRRSLTFLLIVAAHELFPDAILEVDYSVTYGGYYCQFSNRPPLSQKELNQLETRMRDLVIQNHPITKREVPLDEAIAYFSQTGADDKVSLLSSRHKGYLTLYTLRGISDYLHGYMVPATSYLRWFSIESADGGMLLRFPRHTQPTKILQRKEYPKLVSVFHQYGEWLELMHVSHIGDLNQAILDGHLPELILVSEALHEQRIAEIAAEVRSRRERVKLILIAGPSSSGKTTFSRRLSVQLLANGIRPVPISLDDYFVDREKTPLDKNGEYDYESLYAIDLDLFNKQLIALAAGEKVRLPRFNFVTGRREEGEVVQLQTDQLIIVEGIHGLNPALVPQVPPHTIYRIYASALTQLNLDRHSRIPTTDVRLVRRIARDAMTRGHNAQTTIAMWPRVRRGEDRNIFPYQEHADIMFNSALVYELAVLKPLADPLLRQVDPDSVEYVEAKRLLAFLDWFHPASIDVIPNDSILREFIGGSILDDEHFKLR